MPRPLTFAATPRNWAESLLVSGGAPMIRKLVLALSLLVALFLGAGQSLEQHGILGQTVTLYDLFTLSLGAFIAIGIGMLVLFIFPGFAARLAQRLVGWFESRGNPGLARRIGFGT